MAIRGATTTESDTSEAIRSRTAEMLKEILARNTLGIDDIVSVIFTATADLRAEFPSAAAREMGFSQTPLLCSQEIPVRDAIERCVRVLIHCYRPSNASVRHVYLHGARQLRRDLLE